MRARSGFPGAELTGPENQHFKRNNCPKIALPEEKCLMRHHFVKSWGT